MNSLLYAFIEALRCHRWLRLLACAFIFSSLGNGLTQVVVFGLLLAWSAPPALLTLAFLFATVPGFIGSILGERLCSRYSPVSLLILTEGLGLLALLFPLLGVGYHSVAALLAVQSTEALLSGMSWPALTLLFKRGLSETELPAATCLENVIFASQVLLGTGLGVVLFPKIPVFALLTIDAISFLGSLVMLWLAGRLLSSASRTSHVEKGASATLRWQTLTVRQKRSLLILPALAAVGSPAMALLPALAQQLRPQDAAPCSASAFRKKYGAALRSFAAEKRQPDAFCGSYAATVALPRHLSGRLWNAAVYGRLDRVCAGDDLCRAFGLKRALCGGYVWRAQ